MFESLMMYFLLGLWLFITASNWWAGCWIKVKTTHKNISKRKASVCPKKPKYFSWSLWSLYACRLGCLHTVIHLISINEMVFLPAKSDCDTFLILPLMKTNTAAVVFCQRWADDFSIVHGNIRVLKPSSSAKYPDILRAVLLQQSSPTVPAYVSMLWWCNDNSGAINEALVFTMCWWFLRVLSDKWGNIWQKYATVFLGSWFSYTCLNIKEKKININAPVMTNAEYAILFMVNLYNSKNILQKTLNVLFSNQRRNTSLLTNDLDLS